MYNMGRNNKQKKYDCELCNFKCTKASNFRAHLKTSKHINNAISKIASSSDDDSGGEPNTGTESDDEDTPKTFKCDCGRLFRSRNGLWYHKKKCKVTPAVTNDDLMDMLKKQQKQIDSMIIDKPYSYVNVVNNVVNNTVNTNIFLNEQCKNAIPIQSFLQNLSISIKDLEHIGHVGYVDGIRSILYNSFGRMDLYTRPLHCTDLTNETLYIKHGNKWEKDSDEKTELKRIIKAVEEKNYENVAEWEKTHPKALECDTSDNDVYLKIMSETLADESGECETKREKLVKCVLKDVYVER